MALKLLYSDSASKWSLHEWASSEARHDMPQRSNAFSIGTVAHMKSSTSLPFAFNEEAFVVLLQLARFILIISEFGTSL